MLSKPSEPLATGNPSKPTAYFFDPLDAVREAEAAHLEMPEPTTDGRINTMNFTGAMHPSIPPPAHKFIELAATPNKHVLETGAAYGLVCMEALKKGATDYTANDVERKHLTILAEEVHKQMPDKLSSLKLLVGSWPELGEVVEENSYDAILSANMIHFLNQEQVYESFRQFYRLLKPGGKVFAWANSPYLGWLNKSYIAEAEKTNNEWANQLNKGENAPPIPGFIPRVRDHVSDSKMTEKEMDEIALTKAHAFFIDKRVAEYLLKKEGFEIETCEYDKGGLMASPQWALDGREWVLMIASKPAGKQ